MTGIETLRARRITLRIGSRGVPPEAASAERIRQVVEADQQVSRLAGQPDDLNPIVLDPERVMAFVDGLGRLPEATLARLAGKMVLLAAEGMLLAVSSPVEAAAIARGYGLSLPDDDDDVVQATLVTEVRPEHAEAVAARAEAAARAADAEVQAGQGGAPNARWRRFASAKVWEIAARALAAADPKSRARKKQLAEATRAVEAWAAPPWTGMGP